MPRRGFTLTRVLCRVIVIVLALLSILVAGAIMGTLGTAASSMGFGLLAALFVELIVEAKAKGGS